MLSVSAVTLPQDVQGQPSGSTAKPRVEEIVVTVRRPLAESAAAALEAQRKSVSLVSVLSADSVGNLPDQNIAFAIGRLPGVGVERDQGQARYVNLRGAPVYWTTLSFDGLSVVSPQGRDSRFDNIPSAIASQLTVEKAVVPSMAAASVAGNVDIRTRRAFDYDGQKITGKLGYGHVSLGGGKEIDGALIYSNIFMDGRLGVVMQGSYYSREMATDNWETDPYLSNTTDPTKRFAREHENKHYRLTRTNPSGSARIDYRFDDDNSIFASSIYTLFHDDELRDNFIFRLDQGTNAAGVGYTTPGFITANSPVAGTVFGARINARIDYRDTKESMTTNTVGGEHKVADWDASWRLNYTYTSDGRNTPVTAAFQSPGAFNLRPTVDYDFTNGNVNTVKLFATSGTTAARIKGAQVTNIEDFPFPLTSIGRLLGGDITIANTAKLDLARDTEMFGMSTRFAVGGLFTARTKKSRESSMSRAFTTGIIPTYGTFATNDIAYLGSQNLNYTFRYTDEAFTTRFVDDLISSGAATPQNTDANYWKVREEVSAFYAMATSALDWGNVVYGARVEHIKNTGEALVAFPAAAGTPAGTRLVNTSSGDTLVYPSVHVNWDINSEVKARIGATTSSSRPDFDDLRPNFTINDTTQSVSGGNPDAKPEKQRGVDAYVEWYMTPSGFFSAGVFYKDIKDVLVQTSGVFGVDTLDLPGLDRSGYTFTGVGNGGDGHLEGFELAYVGTAEGLAQRLRLPEWMEGLGVNLSGTFTSSKVTLPAVSGVPARTINVLGTSDAVYNIQLTYEKYGLSVRLAYQYRTPWGQSVGAYRLVNGLIIPVDNGDIYWDSDEEMDLSIRYQINENVEAYFDGVNLTNQGARRYGDNKLYPIEFEKFGPRYIGGVRLNF
ncbi:MAG: TonB-dependent receptor [Alphaproteobacteria bacterium]|nr:TonB-dependent receptor [Alphaproteobacteria bacterium]